jgi:hypothetical protein
MFEFLKHWVTRESQLQQQPGFLGLQVRNFCLHVQLHIVARHVVHADGSKG